MRCENRNRLAAASLMPISYPFHSCQEHVRRFGEEASLQARNAVNDASEEPSAMTCVNQNQVYQEETLETPPGNLDGSLASHQPADRQESIEEDSMEFNIHQQVFDENGEYFEKEEQRYLDQLVELFEASPEAQVLQNEGAEPCWIGMLFDYAIRYLGVTPAQMTASDLRELLFDLVPRKISAPDRKSVV